MPYANNQGVHIHYKVEGKGPPLVLQHGLSADLEMWSLNGFVEALKNDYQLILIDARGHGASDKPHNPEAYRMALRVADVVAVLDELKVSKAHYLGYSMGGEIGWGIAKYAPGRFYSLIIGGSLPYEQDPNEPSPWAEGNIQLLKKGIDALVAAAREMWGARWTPEWEAITSANDTEAMIALLSMRERVGFVDVLPTLTVPCLLYVGEADDLCPYSEARKCSEIIPNAIFISFPGLDHIETVFRTDLVLPHITRFLAEVGGD